MRTFGLYRRIRPNNQTESINNTIILFRLSATNSVPLKQLINKYPSDAIIKTLQEKEYDKVNGLRVFSLPSLSLVFSLGEVF